MGSPSLQVQPWMSPTALSGCSTSAESRPASLRIASIMSGVASAKPGSAA